VRAISGAASGGRAHLDPLRAHPHGALHRTLHGAAERDPLGQLVGDVVADELGRELRRLISSTLMAAPLPVSWASSSRSLSTSAPRLR